MTSSENTSYYARCKLDLNSEGCEYYVSADGKIYKYSFSSGRFRLLKPQLSENGFLYVIVGTSGMLKKKIYIGREVAKHFVPNTYGYRYVDYVDGDRTNNHYCNLKWVRHPVTANYTASNKGKSIACIETGEIFSSAYQAAKKLGVSCTRLYQVIGTSRTVCNLHFNYVTESL